MKVYAKKLVFVFMALLMVVSNPVLSKAAVNKLPDVFEDWGDGWKKYIYTSDFPSIIPYGMETLSTTDNGGWYYLPRGMNQLYFAVEFSQPYENVSVRVVSERSGKVYEEDFVNRSGSSTGLGVVPYVPGGQNYRIYIKNSGIQTIEVVEFLFGALNGD